MGGVLRKWTPLDKYVLTYLSSGVHLKISKFSDILLFVISARMFWRNLTKIGQIDTS